MGSGTHVRCGLEALHRLPEAFAELGELARPEEHRRDPADDDELGEAEAEQTHRGDGPAPRTPGTPRGDDARAERRGLAQERGRGSGQTRHGARLGRLRLRRGGLAAGEPGAHDRCGRGEGSHDDSFPTWTRKGLLSARADERGDVRGGSIDGGSGNGRELLLLRA